MESNGCFYHTVSEGNHTDSGMSQETERLAEGRGSTVQRGCMQGCMRGTFSMLLVLGTWKIVT